MAAYKIGLCAKTLDYLDGGGHFWAYLNWALGLNAAGCDVIWTEFYADDIGRDDLTAIARSLRQRLDHYGLRGGLALAPWTDGTPAHTVDGCLGPEDITSCDLMLDAAYGVPAGLLGRCRRSALIDIDPGLLQLWMKNGNIRVAPHDVYFTIGENVGGCNRAVPDLGLDWIHTPPCVALGRWSPAASAPQAPFTTVTQWWEAWMADGGEFSPNDKRAGFLPYLDLPRVTRLPLELAVNLGEADEERSELERCGWRVRDPARVAGTPESYRNYIRASRGEFSCAKPWYVRLKTAWVSDRTLCYLASGKPAVVQYTGPSRFLTDGEGLLRFRTPGEAADQLRAVVRRHDEHAEAARALAERHFDARKVAERVLDRALDRAPTPQRAVTSLPA